MPKAKVEKVTPLADGLERVDVEVGERGVVKTATYTRPTLAVFLKWFNASASDAPALPLAKSIFGDEVGGVDEKETATAFLHRLFVTSLDRKARADVYESLAQESTMVSIGKERKDIMEFPLKNLVKAINGMRGQREARLLAVGVLDENDPQFAEQVKAVDRSIGYGPWRTAAKFLTQGYERDGKQHPAVAKENDASGMIEAIA